ncbi:MAG: AAA family ATPase [Sulfurimonas sp.]|uniref:AAA family ATPase n=1 Tax=Sulfurimonas sp. TaxID=2022749 RepID=UPI003D1192A4
MKIINLNIENFRGISKVSLNNLKDFVVIAGPNGCGKSSIFDAIRLFKSVYGQYIQNELAQFSAEFQLNGPNNSMNWLPLFRNKSKNFEISCEITLDEAEINILSSDLIDKIIHGKLSQFNKPGIIEANIHPSDDLEYDKKFTEQKKTYLSLLKKPSHIGTITAYPRGKVTFTRSPIIELVFSLFLPGKVGVFDFVSANRIFNKEQVGGINLNNQNIGENKKNHALYNSSNKYNQLKSEMASSFIQALIEEKLKTDTADKKYLWESISELFENFFPGKSFNGPELDESGQLSFLVKTIDGCKHDINELSSGEKEILIGYLRLYNSSHHYSVIMLDEPELHLNPRLVRGLPKFYNQHISKQFKNQLWLVTHSDALLKEVANEEDYSVFHMLPAEYLGKDGVQIHEVSDSTNIENAVIHLVGDMAQYSPDSKVIVLEGEYSEFDKKVISKLFPEVLRKVNIISAGSKNNVHKVQSLLEEASKMAGFSQRFFSIVDADSKNGGDSNLSSNRYKWDRYHIENYLLEPKFILEILEENSLSNSELSNEIMIEEKLKEISEVIFKEQSATDLYSYVNKKFMDTIGFSINYKSETPANDLYSAIADKVQKIEEVLSNDLKESSITNKLTEINEDYRTSLDNGEWIKFCKGRHVLRKFVSDYGMGISYEHMRNAIINKMAKSKTQPDGLKTVLVEIVGDF